MSRSKNNREIIDSTPSAKFRRRISLQKVDEGISQGNTIDDVNVADQTSNFLSHRIRGSTSKTGSVFLRDIHQISASRDPDELHDYIFSLKKRIEYLQSTMDRLTEMRILSERSNREYEIRELATGQNYVEAFISDSLEEIEEVIRFKINIDEASKLEIRMVYNEILSIKARKKVAKMERILQNDFKVEYELVIKRNM